MFSERISGSQKETALNLVNHLQTMLAYQQLSMEIYNDAAVTIDGGEITHGDELFVRSQFTFHNPTLVAKYIIPAMEKKIEIFQLMKTKHEKASILATANSNFQQPYQDMTLAISAMLERAHYMYQGFKQWVNDEMATGSLTGLDENERGAVNNAIISLNQLIFQKIGLTYDEWLDIVQDSMNYVRASVKLTPLSKDIFRSRYMSGISGEHVRFFSN